MAEHKFSLRISNNRRPFLSNLNPMRKFEDQYQRLVAFLEDNLLKQGGGITHHGDLLNEDEELTPSLENVIVLTWLKLLHPDLPKLIKQRYGTELRSRTLASIKPEISQAHHKPYHLCSKKFTHKVMPKF